MIIAQWSNFMCVCVCVCTRAYVRTYIRAHHLQTLT